MAIWVLRKSDYKPEIYNTLYKISDIVSLGQWIRNLFFDSIDDLQYFCHMFTTDKHILFDKDMDEFTPDEEHELHDIAEKTLQNWINECKDDHRLVNRDMIWTVIMYLYFVMQIPIL